MTLPGCPAIRKPPHAPATQAILAGRARRPGARLRRGPVFGRIPPAHRGIPRLGPLHGGDGRLQEGREGSPRRRRSALAAGAHLRGAGEGPEGARGARWCAASLARRRRGEPPGGRAPAQARREGAGDCRPAPRLGRSAGQSRDGGGAEEVGCRSEGGGPGADREADRDLEPDRDREACRGWISEAAGGPPVLRRSAAAPADAAPTEPNPDPSAEPQHPLLRRARREIQHAGVRAREPRRGAHPEEEAFAGSPARDARARPRAAHRARRVVGPELGAQGAGGRDRPPAAAGARAHREGQLRVLQGGGATVRAHPGARSGRHRRPRLPGVRRRHPLGRARRERGAAGRGAQAPRGGRKARPAALARARGRGVSALPRRRRARRHRRAAAGPRQRGGRERAPERGARGPRDARGRPRRRPRPPHARPAERAGRRAHHADAGRAVAPPRPRVRVSRRARSTTPRSPASRPTTSPRCSGKRSCCSTATGRTRR